MANEATTRRLGLMDGVRQYLLEVQNEARKITWPSRKEAVAGAIGVIVICSIVMIFLATVDLGLSSLLRWVLE